jgi:hypothetical protein
MIYKWIPPANLIAELEFTYGVKSPEYINLLPLWVTKGLSALNVKLPLEPHAVECTVKNNILKLPTDMTILSVITRDDIPVNRTDKQLLKTLTANQYMTVVSQTLDSVAITKDEEVEISRRSLPSSFTQTGYTHRGEYILHNTGIAELNFEQDDYNVMVYYVRIPTFTDEVTSIKSPMIPDSPEVVENLSWLVLRNLCYRGYKHKIFNVNSQNVHTNPAAMYRNTQHAARNSMLAWDGAEYDKMTSVLNSIVSNLDYNSRNFNM